MTETRAARSPARAPRKGQKRDLYVCRPEPVFTRAAKSPLPSPRMDAPSCPALVRQGLSGPSWAFG